MDYRAWFLRLDRWHQRLVPEGEEEIDKAIETLRIRLSLASVIPHEAAKRILRPFFAAGWCLAAVEHAFRWRPGGMRQYVGRDPGDTDDERLASRRWILERQLAKWLTKDGTPQPPPVEAQQADAAYRVFQENRARSDPAKAPGARAHAARRAAVSESREGDEARQARRRWDRVAEAREKDRRIRESLGALAAMAGLHDTDNVREIKQVWRSPGERRQQESELAGAVASGYLDHLDDLRQRAREQGIETVATPEQRKVVGQLRRAARTEATFAYLDALIIENSEAS